VKAKAATIIWCEARERTSQPVLRFYEIEQSPAKNDSTRETGKGRIKLESSDSQVLVRTQFDCLISPVEQSAVTIRGEGIGKKTPADGGRKQSVAEALI